MTTDILIIGGGVAGLSLGAALAGRASVTLLETEAHLASQASARSAAMYEPYYGLSPVVALSKASGESLRAGGYLTPRGMMLIGASGQDSLFDADCRDLELAEIPVPDACGIMPILNPDTVLRAAYADHAWDIDTDRLLQDFTRVLRTAGGQIVTGAPVQSVSRDGAGWRVTTPQGEFSAPVVVNAAGAWADQVAALAGVAPLGLSALRRSMARIPVAPHDPAGWPMVIGAGESWYAKPDAGALIVSPADEDPMAPHDAWADDMVIAEGLARYEEMVTLPVTRLLATWAGLRCFAPDRCPVIGFDPAVAGFFWLAGQGGYGFQSCFGTAALAADLLCSKTPDFDAALIAAASPGRFAG